jgi:hypothetical protein
MSLEIGFMIIFSLPFPSAISYFKICAQMNESLIPPFTGAEIVKATLKARLR